MSNVHIDPFLVIHKGFYSGQSVAEVRLQVFEEDVVKILGMRCLPPSLFGLSCQASIGAMVVKSA